MVSEYQIAQTRFLWAAAVAVPVLVEDLWRRRIPNTACVLLAGGGLALGGIELGLRGLGLSMLGALAGFVVFLIFHLTGGMGGGDVKLMAGYGAMLGGRDVLAAAMIAAMAGAVIGVATIAIAKLRGRSVSSIPYAPAIVVGALAVLLSRLAGGQ